MSPTCARCQQHAALGPPRRGAFTYDPAAPTPTVGGRRVAPDGGARDNAPREERPDVLTFTTEPFGQPTEIHGTPKLSVRLTSDNPHADLHARLCVVDADGGSSSRADRSPNTTGTWALAKPPRRERRRRRRHT
ncbi:hypothetical protein GT002_05820 [Streptomyces sp. SID4917]|nr:hypothetical protein [Streptomyces sp. SID4917]